MSRSARVFVGGVIALGGLVMARSLEQLSTQPVSPLWLALMGLTAATGLARLRPPGSHISFSISDTFSIVAALLVGPAAGAVTAALDGLVLSCRMSSVRRSVPRLLFNMAFPAIATWVSAHVFLTLAGSAPFERGPAGTFVLMALLAVFGVLDFGLTTVTVATAVALDTGKRVIEVWREHFVGLWITYFGGIFAAMLMMAIDRVSPVEVLMLIAPLPVLLYVAFRHAQARAQDQIDHLGNMNKVYVRAIEALAQAVDTKDQVTHDHVRRVQTQSERLARALGVTDELILEAIKAAALLHDVGKIGIPEHILNKPGKLTPSEFEIMKQHAPMGAEILSVIGFPYPVVPIVRHHHENWDGTGYPDGLAGEAIPIGARILQIVDCFDALTSDRPYRRRISDAAAFQILSDRKGTMYDPRIVDVFFTVHEADAGRSVIPASDGPTDIVAAMPRSLEPRQESVERRAPLRGFYDLGRTLSHAQSMPEIGEALWIHLGGALPAGTFVLYTYDGDSHSLVAGYCNRTGVVGPQTHVALGEGLSGWVAATGQPMVNADPRLDLADAVTHAAGLNSALAVASSVGDRLIAVLTFYSSDADAFTDAHRHIAEAAAEVVASAMMTARATDEIGVRLLSRTA